MRNVLVSLMAALAVSACGSSSTKIDKKERLQTSNAEDVLYLGNALSGNSIEVTRETPELVPVRHKAGCSFPKASADARVVYIKGFSQRHGGGWIHQRFKDEDANGLGVVDEHERLDVIVTDTAQPVFLVIGSQSTHMWTLHTGPGVEIDGVAMNTEHGSSIANLPKGAKVGFVSKDGSPQKKCFQSLVQPLTVEDMVAINRSVSYTPSDEELRKYEGYERKGRQWLKMKFPAKFGGPASETIFADASKGFHSVLIGPIPDDPLQAKPIRTVHYPAHLEVMWAPRKEAVEAMAGDERRAVKDLQKRSLRPLTQ